MHARESNYDDGLEEFEEFNRYEDTFDVFINIIIKRVPTIFILINMTLMIWMVQTIFSSNLDEIPKSIELYEPFLANRPILDLEYVRNSDCATDYQPINLKVLPKITSENIRQSHLRHWSEAGSKFCAKYSDLMQNSSQECKK